MTYTIHISADNLSWDIIHKADEIGGMIEQVLPELISWHDLKENEVEPALDFIRETWGHITVDLCKEIYHGSYCDTPLERKIDLRRNTMNKSLLELLQKEAIFLDTVRRKSCVINDYTHDIQESKSKYVQDLYGKVILECTKEKEKAEENLLKVRKEIKEYLSYIMKL